MAVQSQSQRCCECNGPKAICRNCSCVQKGSKCFSCCPRVRNACLDTVRITSIASQSIGTSVSQPCDVTTSGLLPSLPEPPLSAPDPVSLVSPDLQNTSRDSTDIDKLMTRAFGATLCPTTVPDISANNWVRWWHAIAYLKGKLYHVPEGSVCCNYVDLLTIETSHLDLCFKEKSGQPCGGCQSNPKEESCHLVAQLR